MQLREIMTTDVEAIHPGSSVTDAAKKMRSLVSSATSEAERPALRSLQDGFRSEQRDEWERY